MRVYTLHLLSTSFGGPVLNPLFAYHIQIMINFCQRDLSGSRIGNCHLAFKTDLSTLHGGHI